MKNKCQKDHLPAVTETILYPDIPNSRKLTAKNIVVLIYTMKIKCQKYHLPAVAETIMYPSVQNRYRQQPKDEMQKDFKLHEDNHCKFTNSRSTYDSLTSTSTPAAISSCISASIVCAFGFSTSMSLWWVLFSKCSRASLCT